MGMGNMAALIQEWEHGLQHVILLLHLAFPIAGATALVVLIQEVLVV
jgi:hypothetical protein